MDISERAHDAIPILAGLFAANLFLDWHRVDLEVGGVVAVHAGSSGLTGWGLAAGTFALAIAVLELMRRRGRNPSPVTTPALALAMLGASVAAVAAGASGVDMSAGSVAAETHGTLWPAWVGLALACLVVAAAVAAVLPQDARRRDTGSRVPMRPEPDPSRRL
jgi:hypothetical protein